jgi:hypothetical protein
VNIALCIKKKFIWNKKFCADVQIEIKDNSTAQRMDQEF